MTSEQWWSHSFGFARDEMTERIHMQRYAVLNKSVVSGYQNINDTNITSTTVIRNTNPETVM
jgi:hypothetical protein